MCELLYPALIFIAMGAWGTLHSWLAAFSTKQLAGDLFGDGIDRYYRVIFVGVALLTLLPVLGMVVFLPSRLLWVISPPPWVYITALRNMAGIAGKSRESSLLRSINKGWV